MTVCVPCVYTYIYIYIRTHIHTHTHTHTLSLSLSLSLAHTTTPTHYTHSLTHSLTHTLTETYLVIYNGLSKFSLEMGYADDVERVRKVLEGRGVVFGVNGEIID